ncbi:MAG: phosphate signaling complex protein PhoU [Acidobacteriota bacterium]
MDRHFEEDLKELRERVLYMGGLAETMIHQSIYALSMRKEELCSDVFVHEEKVNDLHIEIDDRSLKLIALHQPVAHDLRFLIAAIKIGSELERIGDQAVNIAENTIILLKYPPLKPLIDIPRMADTAKGMVKDSLESYVKGDPILARNVILRDNDVDGLKDQLFRELLTYMISDPSTIATALPLILISRNLERIADHATNISEDVIYMIAGKDIRHHAEEKKSDPPGFSPASS